MALSTTTTGMGRGRDTLTARLVGRCTAVVRLFGLLALMLAAFAAPAAAQDFPALTGRVVDQADILSESDEVSLTQELAMLEQRTGRQLVVATVPSLQGYPIEDFGYQLGRNWGIGATGRTASQHRGRLRAGAGADRHAVQDHHRRCDHPQIP